MFGLGLGAGVGPVSNPPIRMRGKAPSGDYYFWDSLSGLPDSTGAYYPYGGIVPFANLVEVVSL